MGYLYYILSYKNLNYLILFSIIFFSDAKTAMKLNKKFQSVNFCGFEYPMIPRVNQTKNIKLYFDFKYLVISICRTHKWVTLDFLWNILQKIYTNMYQRRIDIFFTVKLPKLLNYSKLRV